MSLVKVPCKALQKLTAQPVYHHVQPDIAFSSGKGGVAARLHKYSLYSELNNFDAGAKVVVSHLTKRCLYLCATVPLELKASYELSMQGFNVLAGYLTPHTAENNDKHVYHYRFHTNTWLTDEQLMVLAVDFE